MKRTVLAVLLLFSAGCAAEQQRLVFEKPGTPEAQVKKDRQTCLRASITGDDTIVSNILKLDRDAYRRCMEKAGYTIRVQS